MSSEAEDHISAASRRAAEAGSVGAGFGLSVDDAVLDQIPMERLETEITAFAGRLAAATAAWLIWVAAFDRRRGWEAWEQRSCAGWLSWKCGVDLRTAQDHVRVGRSLEHLPEVRRLFLAGRLSYSKVRALSRVADDDNEMELCELALVSTASQLDRICGAMRRTTPRDDPGWTPSVRLERHDDHGRIVLELSIDDFQRAGDAIEAAAQAIIRETSDHLNRHHRDTLDAVGHRAGIREVVDNLGGHGAIQAAAAHGLLTGALETADGPFDNAVLIVDTESLRSTGAADNHASTDHPDNDHPDKDDNDKDHPDNGHESNDCGGNSCHFDNHDLPPLIARRLACDARLQVGLDDPSGRSIDLGREQRVVSRRLRRALHRRDGGMCRFPGCGTRRGLHAHHIVHWADGGPTDLDNLVLICHTHHQSLHEGGWSISKPPGTAEKAGQPCDPAQRLTFLNPDGAPSIVPQLTNPAPERPLPPLRPLAPLRNDALPFGLTDRLGNTDQPLAGLGERLDLHWTIAVLLGNAHVRRVQRQGHQQGHTQDHQRSAERTT